MCISYETAVPLCSIVVQPEQLAASPINYLLGVTESWTSQHGPKTLFLQGCISFDMTRVNLKWLKKLNVASLRSQACGMWCLILCHGATTELKFIHYFIVYSSLSAGWAEEVDTMKYVDSVLLMTSSTTPASHCPETYYSVAIHPKSKWFQFPSDSYQPPDGFASSCAMVPQGPYCCSISRMLI